MLVKYIKKLIGLPFATQSRDPTIQPEIFPRDTHGISRKDISENALKVLYRLKKHNYAAFLVGGGVRDLLIGIRPKDFDVATDAKPEDLKRIFRNCRLIGRRFRLAHIHFGREIIEVATFRAGHPSEGTPGHTHHMKEGMIVRDNVYGSQAEDALRRDFTINALYYNIVDFSVVDYCGGVPDLKNRKLQLIGDPQVRFTEDPLRLLRAVRFAGKLKLSLSADLQKSILAMAPLLLKVAPPRLFDETQKIFLGGQALATFELMQKFELFEPIFPQTQPFITDPDDPLPLNFLKIAFKNTDQRIAEEKRVTPAFLLAVFLWHPVLDLVEEFKAEGVAEFPAMQDAIEAVLREQLQRISVPKRLVQAIREIWMLQLRLIRKQGRRTADVLELPRFRAGYDFLLLRVEAGEDLKECADWWTDFIDADEGKRHRMVRAIHPGRTRKHSSRKRTPSGGQSTEAFGGESGESV